MSQSDFLSTNAHQGDFVGAAVSAGTNSTAPAAGVVDASHPGVVLLRSSTTANSGYQYSTRAVLLRIGGGEQFDIVFRTPAAFTGNTARFGFLDTFTSADSVDGVYFELSATGVIVGKTANNSVRTTSANIATLLVSTWYHCRIAVSNALNATFSVYDMASTLIGTQSISTNMPTASGRETGCGFVATNSGTVATDLINLDYMSFGVYKDLGRGPV